MKILNVVSSIDERTGGGAAERVFQLSKYLESSGNRVTILTTDYGSTKERILELNPVKVILLKNYFGINYIPKPDFAKIFFIVKNSDVVNLFNHWSFINLYTYICIKILNKIYFVTPIGALPVYGRIKILKHIFNWCIGKRIIRDAHGFIAATVDEFSSFESYGVHRERVSLIPNGVNVGDFSQFDEPSILQHFNLQDTAFIFFMGRLNYIKGPDLLINAFINISNKYPNLSLVLAGPDEGFGIYLKQLIYKAGLESRIHMVGFINKNQKMTLIKSCIFMAIPSRQDAMPLVGLECGIFGKPLLITDKSGFSDIENVGGGLLVKDSVEALVRGIDVMLGSGRDLFNMGEKLKGYVIDNFLWVNLAKQHELVFKNTLEGRI
jgi:glycosyltransferase involved in cell wall biosynthesis